MSPRLTNIAIAGLRWVTGLVLLVKSAHVAFFPAAAHHIGETGLPQWTASALGGTEALAAILFLVPATRLVGGYALLFTFASAATVSLLHREFDVGGLLVYGMAVLACMAYRNDHAVVLPPDR